MTSLAQLYDRVLNLSAHRHAPSYLGALSFSEAIFFPVPPDLLLIPMTLSRRHCAWRFALVTTLSSVLGGLFAYAIGLFLYDTVGLWLIELYSMESHFNKLQQWYEHYGIWMIIFAGFLPIPYKVFTIASGVFAMALAPFIIGSLIGRATRFYAVAAICFWTGDKANEYIRRFASPFALILTLVVVCGFVYWSIQP